VLLTGARGTGKSSLVKAVLNKFSAMGLRLIEVRKTGSDGSSGHRRHGCRWRRTNSSCSATICPLTRDEPGYKALKVILDGSISATSENLLIYATSNRRHLMPEYMQENLETKYLGEEIIRESVEEKISLSERFGLWFPSIFRSG